MYILPGVVGAGFNPEQGVVHELAQDSTQGWMLDTSDGTLMHAGSASSWEGQPQDDELQEGDVVVRLPLRPLPRHAAAHSTLLCVMQGMLLDLDVATLTVWVNGKRRGVMVRPGMIDLEGQPVGRLEGPLRWAVEVHGSTAAIEGPLPPPA